MCDKELLVAYVYDELQGAERKAFQHHLATCLACRDEAQELRGTRAQLLSWTAPEPQLDFTIPAGQAQPAAQRFRIAPWPLATAAALVLAAGTLVANVEVRVVNGGVTIRAGSSEAAPAPAASSDDADTHAALAAVEQRVRDLEASLRSLPAPGAASAAGSAPVSAQDPARIDAEDLLRRVRVMIGESEGRQQQQFAVRLMQVVREMQAEHATDLVRMEQTLNQHQAASSDEIFRQREEMRQFYRLVNQQR